MLSKTNLLTLLLAILLALLISFLNVALPWFIFLGILVFGVLTFFIFKNPVIGIFFIAFFLPFERIGAYEFGSFTIRLSQILFLIVILAWLGKMIFQRRYEFVKNPLVIPLVLFLLICLISIPNSLNIERSLNVLIFIVFTALLSVVIPSLIKDKKSIETIVFVLLFSCFLVSVFGIYQFLGDMMGLPKELTGLRELYTKAVLGFPRIQSTAYEPLYFANYLLIPLGLAFALFLLRKSKIKSSWLLILLLIGLISFVLTIARGGYLALVIEILVIGLFYLKKVFTLKNILIFAVILIVAWWFVVQALGFGGGLFNLDVFKEHIGNVFYGPSYQERINTFENAITAWHEQPFLGIGIGGFGPYVAPHPYYMPKDGWRIVNNEFIEILAETGVFGAFVFFIIILVLVARSIKAIIKAQDQYLKAIMIALLGAFVGVLAQYQTFSTLYIMHVWFLIGLMVSVQNLVLAKNLTTGDKIR